MQRTKVLVVFMLILFFLMGGLVKASGPHFQFTMQSWATYTTYDHEADATTALDEKTTQTFFGIRRARLRGKMTIGKITAFLQYSAKSNVLLDAQIDCKISDNLKIRAGRFIGAGSQAAGRTSHTSIDFVERSIVGRNWALLLDRDDYRTFGMGLIGKAGPLNYEVTFHNGAGDYNILPYNNTSARSDDDTDFMPQMDFMASANITKAVSAGISYGPANEKRINASSLTGFLYLQPKDYKAGNIRAKIDFAQVTDEDADFTAMGYGAMAFLKVAKNLEIGAGYATWDWNTDIDDDAEGNITFGFNYSLTPDAWNTSILKLAATFKTHQTDGLPYDPFMFHCMWQVYMH